MTRKDFVLIAETIRNMPLPYVSDDALDKTRLGIARAFAFRLQHTNPNFDSGRFIAACLKED